MKSPWREGNSDNHGVGAFADRPIRGGEFIGMTITGLRGGGLLGGDRTRLAEVLNHQDSPNGLMRELPGSRDKYFLMADSDIEPGKEITMNYRDTPWFVANPEQVDPEGYKDWK